MAYSKTTWVNNTTPALNATNLNKMETGIYDANYMATGRCATFVVAANDSSTLSKQQADYVCDGVADDIEIQAAIDALPASGGKVILLEGNYDITATIEIVNNTTLAGIGPGTILTLANSVTSTVITNKDATPGSRSGTENTNITVSDMYIDGNKDNQGAGTDTLWCVGFSTVRYLAVKNITVKDGWTAGIRTEFCTYVNVLDNIVENSGDDGIAVNQETYYAVVTGNTITNSGQGTQYGAPAGIEIQDGAHHILITNNSISNSYAQEIQVSTHAGRNACHDLSIIGNNCFDGVIGIQISGLITDFARHITVSDNIFTGNSGIGLYVMETVRTVTINNNICNNTPIGMQIKSDYHLIYNNITSDNSQYGIKAESSYCEYNGNNCNDNDVGMAIFDTNNILKNNICSNTADGVTQRYGIVFYAGGGYNKASGNILLNNTLKTILDVEVGNEYYESHSDLLMDVLATSTTHIRSNEDLSVATPITFTLDAQPDIPRTLSWSFDTHAQITEYDMEVIGIDAKGNSITETWDETAGWSGETSNAFATITSIKMTSRTGTGAGDTIDIGITDILGLSNIIYVTSDVFKIKKNNANATVATAQVDTTYDTYDMSVIGLAATDDFTIWYKSNLNIIS